MNLLAITYSHRTRTAVALAEDPPRLVLFDCASYPPEKVRELPVEDPHVPRLLPVLDATSFATAAGLSWERSGDEEALRNRLEIRRFEDLELQRTVDLDRPAGDDRDRTLGALGSDPAGLLVAVAERYGRLHLVDPASGEHHQAKKAVDDRSEEVALDRRARFVLYSVIDRDVYYDGLRLAPVPGDDPVWIGILGGSSREHRDRLVFSRFDDAFAIANLGRRPRLQYFRFDPAVWESRELDPNAPGSSIDDGLPAEEVWSCEPADAVWIRRSGFDLPSADLAILDEDTLIYSGFRSVVVTDPQQGKILRRHDLDHRVQAIAADHVRGRILAATRDGLVVLPL